MTLTTKCRRNLNIVKQDFPNFFISSSNEDFSNKKLFSEFDCDKIEFCDRRKSETWQM